MTKFVMRDGHMVSVERAAILDGLKPGEVPQPIKPQGNGQPAVMRPPRARSEREAAAVAATAGTLTRGQKAALTRAANRKAAQMAAQPLRPRNIDPETGEEVILKEVIEDGEVKQVRVEPETDEETLPTVPVVSNVDASGGEDGEDPFDAAVEAAENASAAGADAPADGETADLEAEALADAD